MVAPNSDNAFTLFYLKFRAAAPKVRVSQVVEGDCQKEYNIIMKGYLLYTQTKLTHFVYVCLSAYENTLKIDNCTLSAEIHILNLGLWPKLAGGCRRCFRRVLAVQALALTENTAV